jgi:hypothetical protein
MFVGRVDLDELFRCPRARLIRVSVAAARPPPRPAKAESGNNRCMEVMPGILAQ